MGLSFLVVLIGIYLLMGLTVKKYTLGARLLLMGVTIAIPGLFYFFW